MLAKIKAFLDLTRAHFFPVWPLLFCSGLVLAFQNYQVFSWPMLLKGALIGLCGFEAGLVLNDIVDYDLDKLDVEKNKLTAYWRPFRSRPLSTGKISLPAAIMVFVVLVLATVLLASTLPAPHSWYVLGLGLYCYLLEFFYQVKKRKQLFPWAQLLGRTDFALFPVAGYLSVGFFDLTALLFFLFFYPLAIAHLGVNDLADYKNDQARKMYSVTVLYGVKGNVSWILSATILHILAAFWFLSTVSGAIIFWGFLSGFVLLTAANIAIYREPGPAVALKVLPLFHATMFIYMLSILGNYFF